MAPHSSTPAWKIPWTQEPGRLQSMGSRRVGHDCATSLSLFTFMHWRRKWQPTPVFLPGESQGRGSLVGCHLWGHTESETTEVTQQQQQAFCHILMSSSDGDQPLCWQLKAREAIPLHSCCAPSGLVRWQTHTFLSCRPSTPLSPVTHGASSREG